MIKQVNLFGYTIRSTSLEEVTSYLLNLRHKQGFHRVVTLNPEMVVHAERHKLLKSWLRKADVVVADGQGVVMASCLFSTNTLQAVTGVDLALTILQQKNISVYLLGGTLEVLDKVRSTFSAQYPSVTLSGFSHGYFEPEERSGIIAEIKEKKPDFIFVCMGFPQQEYMIQSLAHYCDKGIAIGLGGVLDVLSGEVKRAPKWVCSIKCEWLYRTVKQPRRLLRWPSLLRYVLFVLYRKLL